MGLPELWGSPRSRRKCSEIRVSRGSARTVGRRTGGCCLGRPGKSKPEWNQGNHGPANQEPGRASAEEKSPAFRHGDLLMWLLSSTNSTKLLESLQRKTKTDTPLLTNANICATLHMSYVEASGAGRGS